MLSEALTSLNHLKLPDGFKVECFLCDNDPDKGALQVSKKVNNKIELKYLHESKRGIVHARNRLLQESIHVNASYLAFFDDDETLDSQWLMFLLNTINKYKCEAVSGRVIYCLPKGCPVWLNYRNFYGGDRPKTGTHLVSASTNNVIIDLKFLTKYQLVFNEKLNMSGGSDSLFFRQMRDRGGRIISCQEAIAYEKVPNSRANEEWIL